MKKIALAVAAASILVAGVGTASAADLRRPIAKAPPMVAPIFSWTGCYIGGNVGYARADVYSEAFANPAFFAISPAAALTALQATSAVTNHPDGFTAGAGVGCNYQTGMFVIGVEGDINYSDIGFSQIRGPFPTPTSTPHTWEESFRSEWFATARARAGIVFAERNLLYVTGGAAFAEYNWLKALDFPGFVGFRYQSTFSDTRVGWVVGAGWEYAFTNNWSAKVEYLHMDFGSTSAFTATTNAAAQAAGAGFNVNHRFREDVVRVGLNYRFGGFGGPVVAKY
jgi:outer membrane immunogenic protein